MKYIIIGGIVIIIGLSIWYFWGSTPSTACQAPCPTCGRDGINNKCKNTQIPPNVHGAGAHTCISGHTF